MQFHQKCSSLSPLPLDVPRAHPIATTQHPRQLESLKHVKTAGCSIPLLKAGTNPRIVNISTGSLVPVEYNLPYNYCISKAALNMITRYFAVNLSEFGIISIGLYPGWVQTEMGFSGGGNPPLTVAESAAGIVDVVSRLTMKDNEQFIAWNGQVMSRMYW